MLALDDDLALRQAMRGYLTACDALAAATDDSLVLDLADARTIAALTLRKRLTDAGWSAPTGQRTSS